VGRRRLGSKGTQATNHESHTRLAWIIHTSRAGAMRNPFVQMRSPTSFVHVCLIGVSDTPAPPPTRSPGCHQCVWVPRPRAESQVPPLCSLLSSAALTVSIYDVFISHHNAFDFYAYISAYPHDRKGGLLFYFWARVGKPYFDVLFKLLFPTVLPWLNTYVPVFAVGVPPAAS